MGAVKVYLVVGEWYDWEDHKQWELAAYEHREQAEEHVRMAKEHVEKAGMAVMRRTDRPQDNPYDPVRPREWDAVYSVVEIDLYQGFDQWQEEHGL